MDEDGQHSQTGTKATSAEYVTTVRVNAVNVPVFVICATDPFRPHESLGLSEASTELLKLFKGLNATEVTWKSLLGERLIGVQAVPAFPFFV